MKEQNYVTGKPLCDILLVAFILVIYSMHSYILMAYTSYCIV